MISRTKTTKVETHLIDAEGQVLGRLATKIAELLRGKSKIGFTYNQDLGDRVVVYNAAKVRLTGKKSTDKKYYRHSHYPGGLKVMTYKELNAKKPGEALYLAVRNMLPKNRLRQIWLKRLMIIAGEMSTKSVKNGRPN